MSSSQEVLNADQQNITASVMLARVVIVYLLGILLVLWHKRFVGVGSSFDVVLRIIIGSLLANAISGNSPFVPTLIAIIAMVIINWLLSLLTWHVPPLEKYIKGSHAVLFKHNKFDTRAMRKNTITKEDVLEALREQVQMDDMDKIEKAYLENDGSISFVKRQ